MAQMNLKIADIFSLKNRDAINGQAGSVASGSCFLTSAQNLRTVRAFGLKLLNHF